MGFPQVHQPGWADQPAPAEAGDAPQPFETVGEQGPELQSDPPTTQPVAPKRRRASQSSGQEVPPSS